MSDTDYQKIVIKPTLFLSGKACFAQVHDVSVMVCDVQKWNNDLVLQYLEALFKAGNGKTDPASIAIFLGDVFDAGQRKRITEWTSAKGFEPTKRITMISDSLLMRGTLTAYSWLTKTEVKAFPAQEHQAMCAWIAQGRIAKSADIHASLDASFKLLGKKLLP